MKSLEFDKADMTSPQIQHLVDFLVDDPKRVLMSQCGTTPTSERIHRLYGLFRAITFPELIVDRAEQGPRFREAVENMVAQFRMELIDLACWTLDQQGQLSGVRSDRLDAATQDSAEILVGQVLERLPTVIGLLYHDVEAACDGDPACIGPQEVVVCYPGFLAVMIHRLAHELYRIELRLLARILAEWAHSETGIDIHPGANIGHHFFIDHGTGVVIGETCHVGNHVKIYQGVTLGALSFSKDDAGRVIREAKRHPTIEDHVVIYASATILGGATRIGHHSVIGGSVWLTGSVDPHTTVVMESPRLKIRNQRQRSADYVPDYQI